MLQAFQKNKISYLWRTGRRRPVEDVIVAGMFGPLAYLETASAWRVLTHLFDGLFQGPVPDRLTIRLWPRTGGVEPDAIIDVVQSGEGLRVIMEAKWDAEPSALQALRQWKTWSQAKGSTRHVIVAKFSDPIQTHFAQCDEHGRKSGENVSDWGQSRSIALWRSIREKLELIKEPRFPDGVRDWASGMLCLLGLFGERGFYGFAELRTSAGPGGVSFFVRRRRFNWPDTAMRERLAGVRFLNH